jgi:hypothetical protein
MIIELEIPDTLPEGRRASFKKSIVDSLIRSATMKTSLEHTPEGHEIYREQGEELGKSLIEEIAKLEP